jgi:hypothetical protein
MRTFAIAFLLLFTAVVRGGQSSNQPTPTGGETQGKPQSQSDSGRKNAKPNQAPPAATAPVTTQIEPPQSQKEAAQITNQRDQKATTDWWLMLFTGVLALVAVLQLLSLVWQISSTKAATEKQLRAYVLPTSAARFRRDGRMTLKIEFTNGGQTPAYACTVRMVEEFPARDVVPNFELPPGSQEQSIFNLAPAHSHNLDVASAEPPADVQEFLRTAIRAFYVYGDIRYRDVFDRDHVTRFRYICKGRNFELGIFAPCNEGNDAT